MWLVLAALVVWGRPASAGFVLSDPGSPLYYAYLAVAGKLDETGGDSDSDSAKGKISVDKDSRLVGDIHSNGDVDLKKNSTVDGDVSAVGRIKKTGTVTGQVTRGAAPLPLPVLLDETTARALADRIFERNTTFAAKQVVDDVLFVDGDVRFRRGLSGTGTVIATGDIKVDKRSQRRGRRRRGGGLPVPDPGSRLSLIAFRDIELKEGRALRGVLYAGEDVELAKGTAVEGVVLAGRTLDVDKESLLTFVDFDSGPPSVTELTPPDGAVVATATPAIAAAFADDLSGVDTASVVLRVDGVDRTAAAAITADGLSYTPPAPLPEGGHLVELSVSDFSGKTTEVAWSFVTDTVPPAIAIIAPNVSPLYNQIGQIVVEYADATSGVDLATLAIAVDGVDLTASCVVGPAAATCPDPGLAEGSHTLTAGIRDLAGNAAATGFSFDLIFDVDPPALAITAPASPVIYNDTTPAIEVAYSDAVSGIDLGTLAILLDGVDLTAGCTVGAASASCVSPALAPGPHTVAAQIADLAGNAASASFAFELVIDLDPPALAIVSPSTTPIFVDEIPQLVAEYSDGGSGIDPASVVVRVDGVDVTAGCAVGAASVVCPPPVLADGPHEVSAEVSDLAGNTATASFGFEVVSDVEPPVLTITQPTAAVIFNDPTPAITVTYSDARSGVDLATLAVLLDGADITAGCTVGASSASCAAPALTEGPHAIDVQLSDLAGNLASAGVSFELVLDTGPPAVTFVSPAEELVLIAEIPAIVVQHVDQASGAVAAGIDVTSVQILVDGVDVTAGCTVTEAETSCPPPVLPGGLHSIRAVVRDLAGNEASEIAGLEVIDDVTGPVIRLVQPAAAVVFGDATPELVLEYSDSETSVDPASLAVVLDGEEITASCGVQADSATCEPPELAPGPHALVVTLSDTQGNPSTATFDFEVVLRLDIQITAPLNGSLTREQTATVEGTVSETAETVTVGGIPATVQSGIFVATSVPLDEGGNTLTAVARTAGGGVGSASVTVVRDTDPPRVVIQTPRDGFVTTSQQIVVAGEVVDLTSSTAERKALTVFINGRPAAVNNRQFMLSNLLLQPGLNRIVAVCEDSAGNVGSTEITVRLATTAAQRIEELMGNTQTGVVGGTLPTPLTVRLTNSVGAPLANRPVTFAVSRGDGQVEAFPNAGRKVTVMTDLQGRAQALFTLGRRAGAGNHEVTVTSPGFPGPVVFCATAEGLPPQRIVPIVGDRQTGALFGVVGSQLDKPLLVQVFDALGNPVGGVDVNFVAFQGAGSFDGEIEVSVVTDEEGKAAATYTVGPEPGVGNNLVQAGFAGLREQPASFVISGVAPAVESQTRVSGIVLDNQDDPVPGATIHIEDTPLEAISAADGTFAIAGAPVGTIHLSVDGSTSPLPGRWPVLEFEFTTVAGQDNSLGMPIRLLPLDTGGAAIVGGPQDVTLQMDGVAGTELTVFADSVTFPDGSKVGEITFTQVHSDKVPMLAPLGSNFMLAWTIQPPGVRFDPPARIAIPNMGDLLGAQTEMFSFDHDLGEFVSIGTASVTEDGLQLASNPGFGVLKSGWGGCTPPPPPTSSPCSPPTGAPLTAGLTGPVPNAPAPFCSPNKPPDTCDADTASGITARANDKESGPVVVGTEVPVRFEAVNFSGTCPEADRNYVWNFKPGRAGRRLVDFTFTTPGRRMVEVTVTCTGCPGSGGPAPKATDTIEVIVTDIEIAEVISDQIAGAECNKLPPPAVPGANIPMLMGARSGNQAKLKLEATVDPAGGESEFLLGMRRPGSSTVLGEKTPTGASGKTAIEFDASPGPKEYEAVAGWDKDANGKLDSDEISFTYPDKVRVITESDYSTAQDRFRFEINAVFSGAAAQFGLRFLNPAHNIPGAAVGSAVISSGPPLDHPLGAQWNSSCTATVPKFTLGPMSDIAMDVAEDGAVENLIKAELDKHKSVVQAFFAAAGSPDKATFGPFAWSGGIPGLFAWGGNFSNGAAFGRVAMNGVITEVVVQKSGLVVERIKYNGGFDDTYDFANTKMVVVPPARTQAGYPTLGNAGAVARIRVDFDREAERTLFGGFRYSFN